MKTKILPLAALAVGWLMQASASAGPMTISFNFLNDPAAPSYGHSSTLSSNEHSFYSNSPNNPLYRIDAIGWDYSGVTYPKYNKSVLGNYSKATHTDRDDKVKLTLVNKSGSVKGLGLVPDSDHEGELEPPKSIALNFAWLKKVCDISSIKIEIGSSQEREGFYLFGSDKTYLDGTDYPGAPTQIATGPGGALYSIDIPLAAISSYDNFIVTPYGSGDCFDPDILIKCVTVTCDPNPVPEPASIISAAAPVCFGLALLLRSRTKRRSA